MGGSAHTIKKNTDTFLVDASKEVVRAANADKTECMVMSREQNAGQNQIIKTDNKSFDRVERFKYLGTISKKKKIHSRRK